MSQPQYGPVWLSACPPVSPYPPVCPPYPPVCPPAPQPLPAFLGCALQEIQFWSQIAAEQTIALRALVPGLDEATVAELQRLEDEYTDIGARAGLLRENWGTFGSLDPVTGELGLLVNRSMTANTRLLELLALLAQANPDNSVVQLITRHFSSLIRYYQRILEQIGAMLMSRY
ncbi:MAG: hypothetical protein ACM3X4_03795 [Ignavibacteriales bacterium]